MFSKDERLLFAYTYMQFQQKDLLLDFWQDAYIKSMARFIAIVKSRRVGWSFICSLKGLIKAMDPDRIGYTKQFVSYKTRHIHTIWSRTYASWYLLKWIENLNPHKNSTRRFIEALFIIVKTLKNQDILQ